LALQALAMSSTAQATAWNLNAAGLLAVAAVLTATAFLLTVFWLRRKVDRSAPLWQGAAAALFGVLLTALHHGGVVAAGAVPGTVPGGGHHGVAVAGIALILLTTTLFVSIIDDRMRSKT